DRGIGPILHHDQPHVPAGWGRDIRGTLEHSQHDQPNDPHCGHNRESNSDLSSGGHRAGGSSDSALVVFVTGVNGHQAPGNSLAGGYALTMGFPKVTRSAFLDYFAREN